MRGLRIEEDVDVGELFLSEWIKVEKRKRDGYRSYSCRELKRCDKCNIWNSNSKVFFRYE